VTANCARLPVTLSTSTPRAVHRSIVGDPWASPRRNSWPERFPKYSRTIPRCKHRIFVIASAGNDSALQNRCTACGVALTAKKYMLLYRVAPVRPGSLDRRIYRNTGASIRRATCRSSTPPTDWTCRQRARIAAIYRVACRNSSGQVGANRAIGGRGRRTHWEVSPREPAAMDAFGAPAIRFPSETWYSLGVARANILSLPAASNLPRTDGSALTRGLRRPQLEKRLGHIESDLALLQQLLALGRTTGKYLQGGPPGGRTQPSSVSTA